MAGHSKGLKARRRELVGIYWLQGYSVRDIAEKIQADAIKKPGLKGAEKTHYVTVQKDVQAMKAEWLAKINSGIDERRSQAIARLTHLANKAWEQFDKQDQKTTGFLQVIIQAEGQLAKIEGTLAPLKFAGPEGEPLLPPKVEFVFPDGVTVREKKDVDHGGG